MLSSNGRDDEKAGTTRGMPQQNMCMHYSILATKQIVKNQFRFYTFPIININNYWLFHWRRKQTIKQTMLILHEWGRMLFGALESWSLVGKMSFCHYFYA